MFVGDKIKVKSGQGTPLLFEHIEYEVQACNVFQLEKPGYKPGTLNVPTQPVDMIRINRGLVEDVNYGTAWYEQTRFDLV